MARSVKIEFNPIKLSTTMRQFTLFLATLLLVAYAQAKCGTHSPTFIGSGEKTSQAACFSSDPCDSYSYAAGTSTILRQRYNIIYFGTLDAAAQTAFDQQMQFFESRFLDLFGINVTWTFTSVTDGPYLAVDAAATDIHKQMAVQYYKEGYMTVLITFFTNNTEDLLGYASQFPNELPANRAEWYTIMTTTSIFAAGTTLPHEVGHMLGLYHTFIQECGPCAEAVNSPDRNLVGDLCNDTLPVHNEAASCDTLTQLNDCDGTPLAPVAELPLKNYMAYTPDACQTGFTAQQAARARCYSSTTINFLLENPPAVPVSAPAASPTVVSAASVASAGALGLVALLL